MGKVSARLKYKDPTYIGQTVHIKPNYLVSIQTWDGLRRGRSSGQRKAEDNLKDNHTKGILSKKAATKLKHAVNWLYNAAKLKPVWDETREKYFWFKVNFITFTIPRAPGSKVDPKVIKDMLHSFIVYSRKYHGLRNYVWKFEAHKSGDIHIHMTTDTFINYQYLRTRWNALLKKNGLLDQYKAKYQGCTLNEYIRMQNKEHPREQWQYERAWRRGTANNWEQPPTTDVHAVHKVNNIAAYICKYMSKDPELIRDFKGRIWGCNYHLSDANKCKVEVMPPELAKEFRILHGNDVEYKPIYTKKTATKEERLIGEIFFMTPTVWQRMSNTEIAAKYKEHLKRIRSNAAVLPKEYYVLPFPEDHSPQAPTAPLTQDPCAQITAKSNKVSQLQLAV